MAHLSIQPFGGKMTTNGEMRIGCYYIDPLDNELMLCVSEDPEQTYNVVSFGFADKDGKVIGSHRLHARNANQGVPFFGTITITQTEEDTP